jgi:hypothetical protein
MPRRPRGHRGRRKSQELIQRDITICEMADADATLSLQQLGDKFNLSSHGIRHILAKHGHSRSCTGPRNPERDTAICAMAQGGVLPQQIADKLNLSRTRVRQILAKHELTRVARLSKRNIAICAMADADATLRQIPDKFYLSRKVVRQILVRHGVDYNGRQSSLKNPRRIALFFETDLIDELRTISKTTNISVSELIRRSCKAGLPLVT